MGLDPSADPVGEDGAEYGLLLTKEERLAKKLEEEESGSRLLTASKRKLEAEGQGLSSEDSSLEKKFPWEDDDDDQRKFPPEEEKLKYSDVMVMSALDFESNLEVFWLRKPAKYIIKKSSIARSIWFFLRKPFLV